MGMDVYGVEPQGKAGEYFRNNCWYWRPLWNYACEVGKSILTERDHQAGHYNDGYLIDRNRAVLLADLLELEISSGRTAQYEAEYKAKMDAIPSEQCRYCKGTGDRKDLEPPSWKKECGGCNVCHGEGKVRPSETFYPFEVSNVEEFVKFLRASGGFEIH